MTSALSIVSLTFTSISVVIFAGICSNCIQSDSIPVGYLTFLVGFVLSVGSVLAGDRSRVAKASLGFSVALFVVASTWLWVGLRHAGH
jgi:hypothetical protein